MIKTKRLFTKLCIKTIALQNTEEALLFRSTKKKLFKKYLSAPNVMQLVIFTKFFKIRNVKMMFYVKM